MLALCDWGLHTTSTKLFIIITMPRTTSLTCHPRSSAFSSSLFITFLCAVVRLDVATTYFFSISLQQLAVPNVSPRNCICVVTAKLVVHIFSVPVYTDSFWLVWSGQLFVNHIVWACLVFTSLRNSIVFPSCNHSFWCHCWCLALRSASFG